MRVLSLSVALLSAQQSFAAVLQSKATTPLPASTKEPAALPTPSIVASALVPPGAKSTTLPQNGPVELKAGAKAAPPSVNEFFPLPPNFKIEPDLTVGSTPSVPSAKIVKIRQGPYTLAPNGQIEEDLQWGMDAELPCKDCYITAVQGGLEFKDGTSADHDRGVSLMHMYLMDNARDEVCETYNLPVPNRFYATGNERETVRLNHPGQSAKYGYYLDAEQYLIVRFNAVNKLNQTLEVYSTQTYEYIPKASAPDFKTVKTAWLSLGGCGETWFSPEQGKFDLKSYIWESNITGRIVFVSGHVHEGGHNIVLWINSKPVCRIEQIYGRKRTSIDQNGKQHISDNGVCANIGNIKKGDLVHLTTEYDSEKHPFDADMGATGNEYIMAVNNIYIGAP